MLKSVNNRLINLKVFAHDSKYLTTLKNTSHATIMPMMSEATSPIARLTFKESSGVFTVEELLMKSNASRRDPPQVPMSTP